MKTSVTTRFAGRGPAEIFAASLVAFACLAGLVCLGLLNYLLFHSLVELGAVAVAWSVFLLTWNTRRLHVPSGFLVLGLAYACVGSLDLLHTLAYEGMGIFVDSGSNLATQLWLSARYIESAALLIFPFVFGRRIPPWAVTIFLTGISTLLLGAIFFWGIFPVCFDPETGLTAFKKASEYAVMGVLALAGTFIRRRRFSIGTRIAPLLLAATGMTILSEFSFTLYAHPYGLANMAGHLCKVISFFFIYRALIVQSLQEPLETLARDLRRESERYTRIVQTAIDGFWLLDVQGRICETNTAAAGMLGYSQEELNRLSIRDIDVQESPEETSRHLARIAAQGYDRFETLHRRKDGEILQVEASCRYLEQEGEWFIVFFRDVSARKQAEARLRLQARLLDQVSDAVIATDLALRITAWNAAAERIYGWTEAEALGEPIDELLGTRWLDVSLSRARAELEAKGAWKGDVQQRHKEGHRLMIEASVSWTYDVYGSRSGGVCVNRDVTRRKQTEEALRHSEHRYRSFIEHATEGIYMLALGDPIAVNLTVEEQVEALYDRAYLAECNDAFARMYGLDSGSQLLGKRLEDFHGGRDHPVNRAEARKFIESGYQIANEETLEADLNGEERWFANTTVGIVEKGCLQSMWGTQTDITERKQASIALAASESRHRSIVAALPDLLFRVDQDLQITEVQTKVPEMLLAPVDQLIGKSLREILPQPAADLNCRKALAALQNGEMQVFEYALDMQYGQRECETRMLACGQNEVQALVRDITERKDLERRLMEASEREQKRLAQELHDGLCQDLKSLEMETALLEDFLAGQSPEAAARAAAIGEQVNHSVRRAYALARGLLPAWLDEEKLGTALSGLEHRYQSQTDGRIRFSVQNEVQAKDAQQAHHVYRIAQEALNNALVHARASDIELSWRSEGDQRVLEVRDNGKGFDPETPEKVGKSMGVTVMRTRARLIRADLQIQGRAAGGTVVRLVLAD